MEEWQKEALNRLWESIEHLDDLPMKQVPYALRLLQLVSFTRDGYQDDVNRILKSLERYRGDKA